MNTKSPMVEVTLKLIRVISVCLFLTVLVACGTNKKNGVYIVDTSGGEAQSVFSGEADYYVYPTSWSPKGDKIGFNISGSKMAIVDVSTQNVDLWSREFRDIDGLCWSPDGTQMIINGVHTPDDGLGRLFLADVNGTVIKPLTPPNWLVRSPHWIPATPVVVFARFVTDRPIRLYALNVDTGSVQELYNLGSLRASDIAWSPDGTQIAFSAWEKNNAEIYILNLSTGNSRRVTFHEASDTQPSWSPDGKKLAFVSNRDGEDQIYVMDLESGQSWRITNMSGAKVSPSFSPDGSRIVFTVQHFIE